MGDLQVDLNTALVAVKQKCVDLDEKIRRENERPENRGRGYLGVRRYIYALTTKNNENHLQRRGRSLTRVYVEQKFYRSKSVPSPDQVQRLEDCTQDYGPNNEERLEYVETIDAPLDELIKEDQSHQQMVSQRLPKGHAEWDHELAVYEEDAISGRLEDRTLTLKAGDHPFGMNQFNEVAGEVSARIAKFFSEKEENHIRTRELSLSVHPVYHQSNGDAYTSFGMSRSRSMGSVAHEAQQSSNAQNSTGTHGVSITSAHHESRPRLDQVSTTTKSLSNLYNVDTRHYYQSRYGQYISGYGHYGNPLPPAKNQEVMPKMPVRKEEHIYDEPIRRDSQHHHHHDISHIHTTTKFQNYERKYDFKSTFPPGVEMPEGYHDYYDPSKFMFLDPKGYYQGNITRPLHYSYSRDYLEKYSDYDGSRRTSPIPPIKPPEPEYIALHRTVDLPKHETHLKFSFPDYYDHSTRIILKRTEDLAHQKFETRPYPDYYDNIHRIILSHTKDLEHQEFHVGEFPEYYDLATRYTVLQRSEDIPHQAILVEAWPEYRPYETQELIETFDDEEPVYEEVYEPVVYELHYTRDPDQFVFIPSAPLTPLPPPPPFVEEIHVAIPVEVIEEPPIPAERHYEEIYIGREALDVSVSPTFNQQTDQKNLGLEKSVHDRVREMEETMRSEEKLRLLEEEKRRKYEERQNEIRSARLLEEQEQAYNAYEEIEERKDTPLPQPIHVPEVFIPVPEPVPEKPKRTWQPPPKPEIEIDEHMDKPLGPVIFHELIYQQGILRQKFQEEHRQNMARPVSHPVSRANSRPTTPGLEVKSIDFPRLDDDFSARDHTDSTGNIDYVHERIERYNAYGASAQDSQLENRTHSHVRSNTVNAHSHHDHSHDHPQNIHHHVHSDNHSHSHSTQVNSIHSDVHVYEIGQGAQVHRGSVVYDEPHGQAVYDVPHDLALHHYDSVHHGHDHHHTHQDENEIQYQLAKTNQAIRQMSKTNKWEENEMNASKHAHIPPNSPFVKKEGSRVNSSSAVNTTTTTTVLHHSNSLNRQNIPPPLRIENGNSESYHDHHHQHVHFDNIENPENVAHHISKSTTSLDYQPVNVGHVKNLAKLFNKHDEKPITTEQVIYRVRAAPPGHHFQQEIKPRPRSMPPIPMDEIELHEHGERDHLTRHQHEMEGNVEQHGSLYSIGGGVAVTVNETKNTSAVHHSQHTPIQSPKSPNIYHNSHYHHHQMVEEEPTIRVRRVYKALEDTSMLSPVSLPNDEPMYDIPTGEFQ